MAAVSRVSWGGWGMDKAGCVVRRHAACTCRTAAVSLSLAEGVRVRREEIYWHVYTFAVAQWAVHVQLQKELAMRWSSRIR